MDSCRRERNLAIYAYGWWRFRVWALSSVKHDPVDLEWSRTFPGDGFSVRDVAGQSPDDEGPRCVYLEDDTIRFQFRRCLLGIDPDQRAVPVVAVVCGC